MTRRKTRQKTDKVEKALDVFLEESDMDEEEEIITRVIVAIEEDEPLDDEDDGIDRLVEF